VCFSGTPRTTRATAALTSPLAGSSSLAMWCLMSSYFPSPPHHPHPTLTLTSSLSFRLMWWSSHLSFLSLQVLAHCLSVLLLAQCLARVRWCHLRWCRLSVGPHLRSPPGRAGVVGLYRLRGRRYRPLRLASPSRCGSTSTSPPGAHVAGRRTATAGPSSTLRPAGARLPAPAAAAGVRTSTGAVPTGDLTSGGPVPARDPDTSAVATSGTCRDAGVPPTAPSP
jgi:hypothetical protein